VITADKSFLTERVGGLPIPLLRRLEDGLHLALDL